MAKIKYEDIEDDWIYPVRKGYKLKCCDCGLVHVIDFDIIDRGRGNEIRLKFSRDERATAAVRRKTKRKWNPKKI